MSVKPKVVKLRRGRGVRSHLLVAWPRLHLFVWTRGMAADFDKTPSYGLTLRVRRTVGWTHMRVSLLQRNRSGAELRDARPGHRFLLRGTLTLLEVSRWDTSPGTSDRLGLKSYVRFKVSPGGREVPR